MQAIVFGGSGFIGTHLIEGLVASGRYEKVISIDLRAPKRTIAGAEYVIFDIREEIPCEIIEGGDAEIFNLAAVHTTPGHEDWEYYWTNILGATNVCKFAALRGVKKVVFTSSISIYGPSEEPKDEMSTPQPVSAYGRSKLMAEHVHQQWLADGAGERSLVIVRPAVIFGLGEGGNFTRLSRLLQTNRFVYPGRTGTIKACGNVYDLAAFLQSACHRTDALGIYNFCYPNSYSSEAICRAFCEVGNYRKPALVVPLSIMLAAAYVFEVLSFFGLKTSINRARIWKLVQSTNIVPKKITETDFKFKYQLSDALAHWKRSSRINDFD